MNQTLPRGTTLAEFRAARALPLEVWSPAIRDLATKHGLEARDIDRLSGGENPAFTLDDAWVIKFTPPDIGDDFAREVAALAALAHRPEVRCQRMLAQGTCDGWSYVISSRMRGVPLHRAWSQVPESEKLGLARDFGQVLRNLHHTPTPRSGVFGSWRAWVQEASHTWPTRWGVDRLPTPLRIDGPRFLAAAGFTTLEQDASTWRLLHGDLAPENAFAIQDAAGTWRVEGMIDFGNAGIGDPIFDYTAPTVLLQPGDARTIRAFLTGAGVSETTPLTALRPALMAYTLIHPMADLLDCLELIPDTVECTSWDAVAERFWPEAG